MLQREELSEEAPQMAFPRLRLALARVLWTNIFYITALINLTINYCKYQNFVGQEECLVGQEESLLGQEESLVGQEESLVGKEESPGPGLARPRPGRFGGVYNDEI